MSSPAELLAAKHAQAVEDETPSSAPSATSLADSPALIDSYATASTEESSPSTTADEIAEVAPKKPIRMDDDAQFPSLGSSVASPIAWGPAVSQSTSSSWGKPVKSFKPAVKSTSTQHTFIIDDEQQQNLANGEIFKIFAKINSTLNVKVESTHSSATKKRTFLLNGPIDNVATAKRELIRQLTKPTKITFEIPSKLRSTVIGSGGRTLKPIIESTSVKIDIAKDIKEDDEEKTLLTEDEELFGKSITVTIEGDIQGCSDAKEQILAIVNENTKNLNVKIPVSEKLKPFVAAEVSKLSFAGDVEAIAPEATSRISFIMVSGSRDAVIDARNQIKSLLVDLDNQIIVNEEDVPKNLHQLIGTDKVLSETNVVIEIPSKDDASTKVRFIGVKSNIPKAISLAKSTTSDYFVDTLDLSKSHGGNLQHAKNLTAYFTYTKYFDALSSEHEVSVSGPSYKNLADSNSKSVVVSFISSKDKKENVKKARKDLIDMVNKITPTFVRTLSDIDSFIFSKIDNQVAIENNVSIVPLGSLAGVTNILILVVQINDDEFLPSIEQINQRLDNVDKSLDKLRALNKELISEVIEISAEDQKHLEGNTLKNLLNKFDSNSIEIKLHQNAEGPSENEIYLRGFKSEIKKAAADINQLVEDIKNYEEASKYNTTIEFPTKYLARLIGQKGSHLSELQDDFDVRIDVVSQDNDKLENAEIKITGLVSNVEECIKKISALKKKWADETTKSVQVEQKYFKQLIGSNGVYAKRLQDKYNVKIQFSDSKEKVGTVLIRGPSRGVAKVEEEIKQLLDYEKEHGYSETFSIPAEALARVIGKNGDNINDLSIDCEVKIQFQTSQAEAKETGFAQLEIKGSKSGIKDAKAKIDEIVERVVNFATETIEVDPKWYRHLIGPNGMTMRETIIKAGGSADDRDFRRFIQFPNRDSDSKLVVCEGDKAVVAKIVKSIQDTVADLESVTEETIEVPKSKHRFIIGPGGSIRREIEAKNKVRLFVPKQGSESDEIRIKGKPEGIKDAIAKIQELTAEKK